MKNIIDVIKYISDHGPSKPWNIASWLGIHRVVIQKLLKTWIVQWYISKSWNTPHVIYDITDNVRKHNLIQKNTSNNTLNWSNKILGIDFESIKILNSFYKFESDGDLLTKKDWFVKWCQKRWLDIQASADKYICICQNISKMKDKCGLIETTKKFAQWLYKKYTYKMYIDKMYYADRYTYDEFGRWPLAEMTFFAKQSQNLELISQTINNIYDQIECLIYHNKIDAIAIIPRSIDRKHQFLKLLKNKLEIFGLPFVDIYKYYPQKIAIAQKTLKWEARFTNAMNTIQVSIDKQYDNILLIDDFVWSGATMNISAMKIKNIWVAKYIIWFAIVGNMDMSYDVINEI